MIEAQDHRLLGRRFLGGEPILDGSGARVGCVAARRIAASARLRRCATSSPAKPDPRTDRCTARLSVASMPSRWQERRASANSRPAERNSWRCTTDAGGLTRGRRAGGCSPGCSDGSSRPHRWTAWCRSDPGRSLRSPRACPDGRRRPVRSARQIGTVDCRATAMTSLAMALPQFRATPAVARPSSALSRHVRSRLPFTLGRQVGTAEQGRTAGDSA